MERKPNPARDDEEAAREAVTPERKPGVPPHEPPAEGRDEVDVGSEESMPASDPPAHGGPAAGD